MLLEVNPTKFQLKPTEHQEVSLSETYSGKNRWIQIKDTVKKPRLHATWPHRWVPYYKEVSFQKREFLKRITFNYMINIILRFYYKTLRIQGSLSRSLEETDGKPVNAKC